MNILPVKNQKAKRFSATKIIDSKDKNISFYQINGIGQKWIPKKVCRFSKTNSTIDIQEWYLVNILKIGV